MIQLLVFAAVLLSPPVALAQEALSPPLPQIASESTATPEQISAATARANRLIDAANAQGIFVNKTDSGIAQVEHVASGMRCLLDENPANRLHIFPSTGADMTRGDDVSCVIRDDATDTDITIYATRYPGGMSTEGIMAGAVSGIRQRWPDAIAYEGELTTATLEGHAAPAVAAFQIQFEGKQMLTLALGVQEGDWSFKVRITGPFEEAMGVSLYGAITMTYVQMNLKDD